MHVHVYYYNLKGKQQFVIRVLKKEPLFYRKGSGTKAQLQSELNLHDWHTQHVSVTLVHPVCSTNHTLKQQLQNIQYFCTC